MTTHCGLIVEGECRMEPWPWQNPEAAPPTCERGTLDCYAVHTVYEPGTKCRRHDGHGGHYTCPDSDRIAFTCTNYAGRHRG